jgi:hypothetical protein
MRLCPSPRVRIDKGDAQTCALLFLLIKRCGKYRCLKLIVPVGITGGAANTSTLYYTYRTATGGGLQTMFSQGGEPQPLLPEPQGKFEYVTIDKIFLDTSI